MFHVELRQFPHVARAFNLSEQELDERFIGPWLAGRPVRYNERRWAPERARLTIYEGPQLRSDQMGLGRGWAEVTRSGSKVTEELLANRRANAQSAAVEARGAVLALCAEQPLTLQEVTRLAGSAELGEQVVLELLREGVIAIAAKPRPH